MIQNTKSLIGMVVDNEKAVRECLSNWITNQLDATIVHSAADNDSALTYIKRASLSAAPIDFITTDMYHSGGHGLDLIKQLRSFSDSIIISGCLRARHLPIIMVTGQLSKTLESLCNRIDPKIRIIAKPVEPEVFIRAIVDSVGEYRHRILEGFHGLGLTVFWQNGAYRIGSAYSIPPIIESAYVAGDPCQAASGYARLLIVDWHWANANVAVELLEQMINDPSLNEKDFQHFFERHPEFLLEGQYDSYWAEPHLNSVTTGVSIRPDFVLQPCGDRTNAWNWNLVELKRHNVDLLTNRKVHADLSRYVTRVVTQLRDYKEFFEDPRNSDLLKSKFGGVLPNPQLTAIIGRLPTTEKEVLIRLKRRTGDINIRTYDEVLEFRRTKVEQMTVFQHNRMC